MQKAKIHGIGSAGDYSYLIVGRDKHFFEWLREIFSKFENLPRPDGIAETDEEGFDTGKYILKKIKDFEDAHEMYSTIDNFRVEVFHGMNRAFLILHTTEKNREKFMDVVEKNSEFITKPEKKLPASCRTVSSGSQVSLG